jgi:hypothetical protein
MIVKTKRNLNYASKIMNLKETIVFTCHQSLHKQIMTIQNMITDLAVDALNDAKGSAGDKHEVGLAMMHLEQEKLNHKLSILLHQKQVLGTISFESQSLNIVVGSLVKTKQAYFLLGISLPQFKHENALFFPISPDAPLAKEFLGKKANDTVVFNGVSYLIEEIL